MAGGLGQHLNVARLDFADETHIAHDKFGASANAVLHVEMPVVGKIPDAPMIGPMFDSPSACQQLIMATRKP
jgi:hypothetical protein